MIKRSLIICVFIALTGCSYNYKENVKENNIMNNEITQIIPLKKVANLQGKTIEEVLSFYSKDAKDIFIIQEPLFSIAYISLDISKDQSIVMFFDKEMLKLPRYRENYDLNVQPLLKDKPKKIYLVKTGDVSRILRTRTIEIE